MGISALFSSLVKGVPWTKVAGMAMEYGPELYRKALGRFQQEAPPRDADTTVELQERLTRLEALLLEQEALLREQVAKNDQLEKRCISLESSLLQFQIIAGALALGCIVLLAVLFK
jgi:hypothetical protein